MECVICLAVRPFSRTVVVTRPAVLCAVCGRDEHTVITLACGHSKCAACAVAHDRVEIQVYAADDPWRYIPCMSDLVRTMFAGQRLTVPEAQPEAAAESRKRARRDEP